MGTDVQVRSMVHDVAQKANTASLAQVPILTVEPPAMFSTKLIAAVDAVGATIQPFFSSVVDTSQSR